MSTIPDTVFLSVRVPVGLRGRLKAAAAKRRVSLQQLMREAIEELVSEAEKAPPDLGQTMATLRAHADDFRRQGVSHLYLFGSIVRGEARADSDVDVAIDIDPEADFSLLDLVGVKQMADELLGRPTDLVERAALKRYVRPAMEREALQVF